ncbi:hypothetical protein SprV_0902723700 [Sparganum proliferum]
MVSVDRVKVAVAEEPPDLPRRQKCADPITPVPPPPLPPASTFPSPFSFPSLMLYPPSCIIPLSICPQHPTAITSYSSAARNQPSSTCEEDNSAEQALLRWRDPLSCSAVRKCNGCTHSPLDECKRCTSTHYLADGNVPKEAQGDSQLHHAVTPERKKSPLDMNTIETSVLVKRGQIKRLLNVGHFRNKKYLPVKLRCHVCGSVSQVNIAAAMNSSCTRGGSSTRSLPFREKIMPRWLLQRRRTCSPDVEKLVPTSSETNYKNDAYMAASVDSGGSRYCNTLTDSKDVVGREKLAVESSKSDDVTAQLALRRPEKMESIIEEEDDDGTSSEDSNNSTGSSSVGADPDWSPRPPIPTDPSSALRFRRGASGAPRRGSTRESTKAYLPPRHFSGDRAGCGFEGATSVFGPTPSALMGTTSVNQSQQEDATAVTGTTAVKTLTAFVPEPHPSAHCPTISVSLLPAGSTITAAAAATAHDDSPTSTIQLRQRPGRRRFFRDPKPSRLTATSPGSATTSLSASGVGRLRASQQSEDASAASSSMSTCPNFTSQMRRSIDNLATELTAHMADSLSEKEQDVRGFRRHLRHVLPSRLLGATTSNSFSSSSTSPLPQQQQHHRQYQPFLPTPASTWRPLARRQLAPGRWQSVVTLPTTGTRTRNAAGAAASAAPTAVTTGAGGALRHKKTYSMPGALTADPLAVGRHQLAIEATRPADVDLSLSNPNMMSSLPTSLLWRSLSLSLGTGTALAFSSIAEVASLPSEENF